jgi:hypothetical protein
LVQNAFTVDSAARVGAFVGAVVGAVDVGADEGEVVGEAVGLVVPALGHANMNALAVAAEVAPAQFTLSSPMLALPANATESDWTVTLQCTPPFVAHPARHVFPYAATPLAGSAHSLARFDLLRHEELLAPPHLAADRSLFKLATISVLALFLVVFFVFVALDPVPPADVVAAEEVVGEVEEEEEVEVPIAPSIIIAASAPPLPVAKVLAIIVEEEDEEEEEEETSLEIPPLLLGEPTTASLDPDDDFSFTADAELVSMAKALQFQLLDLETEASSALTMSSN